MNKCGKLMNGVLSSSFPLGAMGIPPYLYLCSKGEFVWF